MLNFNKLLILIGCFSTSILLAESDTFTLKKASQGKSTILTKAEFKPTPVIHQQSWKLSNKKASSFLGAKNIITIADFPLLSITTDKTIKAAQTPIVFTRYDVFAKGAKIYQVSAIGKQLIARPNLLSYSSFKHGIGLTVNPTTGAVQGYYNHQGISLDIGGNIRTLVTLKLQQERTQNSNIIKECATKMANQPKIAIATLTTVKSSSLAAPVGGISYQANIAVDTDNEWMAGKGNNTTTAMNYITNLFVNMNVYFERDFATRLLIGDVFLRTTTDPYPTEPDITNYLTDFGEYWRVNQTAIDRDFAIMLSGQNISSNSFSGIAWLNLLCNDGFQIGGSQTAGSFSVNRIGSNAGVGFISQFVAHELGHNFGSPHTHCYTPVVDQCFNNESGCYAGAESCPAGGGMGTIMSYCHLSSANCGNTNNETFHPTVISRITGRIAANSSATCLVPFVDTGVIFANGFE